MQIALFGGSFDPPHLGHVLAAVTARALAGVDAVWVLPVANHPYAKRLSPWAQRWDLCQSAFSPLGPWVAVRDDELRNSSGFTIDLVLRLTAEHPEHQWSLIGGSDTAADMMNWHRGPELARMVTVIAIPRRGQGGDAHPAALPAISSSQVRELLATTGDAGARLPLAVARLIHDHQWYHTPPKS